MKATIGIKGQFFVLEGRNTAALREIAIPSIRFYTKQSRKFLMQAKSHDDIFETEESIPRLHVESFKDNLFL